MAYNAHDIDDGLRSGLLALEALRDVALFARMHDAALARAPRTASDAAQDPALAKRVLGETLRRMLATLVADLVDHTAARLAEQAPSDADAVRQTAPLAGFSPARRDEVAALKHFLFRSLYRHPQVMETTARARTVVTELFAAYLAAPEEMSVEFALAPAERRARAVADYVAGMTDRFALREHQRLTGRRLFEV